MPQEIWERPLVNKKYAQYLEVATLDLQCVLQKLFPLVDMRLSLIHERLLDLNNYVNAFIPLPNGFKTPKEIFTIATWSQ